MSVHVSVFVCLSAKKLSNGCTYQKTSVTKVVTLKKMAVLFLSFWIRSIQNGSNLIKLDQMGFPPIKNCYYKKLSHLPRGYKWLLFYFFGSDLSKMDQT